MKTIWNKQTGEAREYESVDAREILKHSDVYTDHNPRGGDPKDPDGDGIKGAPQNEASVQDEFRREPVGDDPPAKERDQVIIRNPVTDQPRMAPRAEDDRAAKDAASEKARLEAVAASARAAPAAVVDPRRAPAVDVAKVKPAEQGGKPVTKS